MTKEPADATRARSTTVVHGSCVRWFGRGVLLRGASGAGKSAAVAELLAAGAHLVADDLVRLTRRADRVVADAAADGGLIEVRGTGIYRLPGSAGVALDLDVELVEGPIGRLAPPTTRPTGDVTVPSLVLPTRCGAVAPRVLIALAARRVA